MSTIPSNRRWSRSGLAAMAVVLVGACERTEPVAPMTEGLQLRPAFEGGPEYADVMNQNGIGIYSADGSALVRQPNGIRVSMTVPTPRPGDYTYPPGGVAGHPEVFTLWAFVFNYPQNCTQPCNGDDLGDGTGAIGGVYNVGGHVGAGRRLTISGRLGVGEAPVAFSALESPETAEVHVALAPHGALDPSLLPDEFRAPAGSPGCACWWVAIFE